MAGKIFSYIFPFQIKLHTSESAYIQFYVDKSSGYIWIVTNILLAILTILLLIKKNRDMKKNMLDVLVVVFTGVFGFVAISLFSNKFN
jgi:TctA family transporter